MLTSVYDMLGSKRESSLDVNTTPARPQLEPIKLTSAPLSISEAPKPTASTEMKVPTQEIAGATTQGISSNYMGMIGQAAGAIGSAIPRNDEFNNAGYSDQVQVEEEAREQSVGAIKDTVSSAFGPWGMLFRGIEKIGNGIGEGIGGRDGAVVSSIFSPDEAIMANNSDPDVKTGDKILGSILPMYAAVSSNKAKQKRKDRIMIQRQKEELNKTVLEREADQRMAEGLRAIEAEEKIVKSQLGLTANY